MPEITLEKLEELLGPNLPGTKQQLERLQRIVAQEIEQHGEEQVRSQAQSLRSQWEYA